MADIGAYEFTDSAPEAPVISPSGGSYNPPLLITIIQASGADIFYTLNGIEPTSASTLYTEPFYIDGTIIMAIALLSGTYSSITSGSFSAIPATFTLSGGIWVRDVSKFETSASNYEDKPSLQDNLIVDIEVSATANKNEILSSVSTISGDVNIILTSAHGSGQWDAVSVIGEVVLSASQPNYPAALQSTLLGVSATIDIVSEVVSDIDSMGAKEISATANKNEILSSITSVSGDVLSLGTPMQSGTPVTLDPNTRAILSAGQPDYDIPSLVNATLTSAHGSGQWDAITIVSQVVLSADQPYYAPAKTGDEMALTSASIADIRSDLIKHADTVDGKTIDYVLEAVMAMVNGNFALSGDTMTLYKRDGSTPFSVMTKTSTSRTRTS